MGFWADFLGPFFPHFSAAIFAGVGPFSIFLPYFSGLFAPGPFPIPQMATSIARGGGVKKRPQNNDNWAWGAFLIKTWGVNKCPFGPRWGVNGSPPMPPNYQQDRQNLAR